MANKRSKDEWAADVASRLLKAAELFAERDPFPSQTREQWTVWWDQVPEAAMLFRQAVDEVMRSNPSQLSYSDTAHLLTYGEIRGLASVAIGDGSVDKSEIKAALQKRVMDLANSQMNRRLQFVIENLAVDGEVPKLFNVELVGPTWEEMQAIYDDGLIRSPHTSAVGFANLDAPGDRSTAFDWGIRRVESYLNLLRGCGSELMAREFLPIHVIDRNPVLEFTSVRELTDWGPQTSVLRGAEIDRRSARACAHLLRFMNRVQLDRLTAATTATSTMMHSAVVTSLETVGEACKPHQRPTQMLLLSSALEMLVGARWHREMSYRGKTAAIAERSKFLIGGSTELERQSFDKRVRKLYGLGSDVRHGDRPEVSDEDVIELADITRGVAFALLERPELGKPEDLDRWVQRMRYTTDATL